MPPNLGDGPRSLAAALHWRLWPHLPDIHSHVRHRGHLLGQPQSYIFRLYKKTDHTFNLLNVFCSSCASRLCHFPTAVLGEYVAMPHQQRAAVIFYAFGFWLCGISWDL